MDDAWLAMLADNLFSIIVLLRLSVSRNIKRIALALAKIESEVVVF